MDGLWLSYLVDAKPVLATTALSSDGITQRPERHAQWRECLTLKRRQMHGPYTHLCTL